jgi:hypothetical protein
MLKEIITIGAASGSPAIDQQMLAARDVKVGHASAAAVVKAQCSWKRRVTHLIS